MSAPTGWAYSLSREARERRFTAAEFAAAVEQGADFAEALDVATGRRRVQDTRVWRAQVRALAALDREPARAPAGEG